MASNSLPSRPTRGCRKNTAPGIQLDPDRDDRKQGAEKYKPSEADGHVESALHRRRSSRQPGRLNGEDRKPLEMMQNRRGVERFRLSVDVIDTVATFGEKPGQVSSLAQAR